MKSNDILKAQNHLDFFKLEFENKGLRLLSYKYSLNFSIYKYTFNFEKGFVLQVCYSENRVSSIYINGELKIEDHIVGRDLGIIEIKKIVNLFLNHIRETDRR